MSIRKRKWTASGIVKEAWVVDYADGVGTRRLKTFKLKKDADAFAAKAHIEVREGIHVADSASITVAEAGALWIARAEAVGLEKATLTGYRQNLERHIAPFLGRLKLSHLSVTRVRDFEDKLRDSGRSPVMVRRLLGSLSSIIADAQERGLVAHNAVKEMRGCRRRKSGESRQKGKLKIGIDIPAIEEVKAIIANAQGRWRPLFVTAIFTGLRASELRGLRWIDIDLDANELHVRQRADRYNEIGRPKSAAGERTVPFGKFVGNVLREWKLACPPGELVFPNGVGKIENLTNIIYRGFMPAQKAAGVVTPDGKAKYTGLHSLRHFYASWSINRRADGGLELPPKVVQERLGHASITMTYDVYGHLFPRGDDAAERDAAELALLA